MSEQTKAALDDAIAAHIANEVGDATVVTGYVLHAATLTFDQMERGITGYFGEYAEGQPHHVAIGLAHMHLTHLTRQAPVPDDDDDED